MTQHPPRFTRNHLRWAISAALLTYSLPGLSEGITPLATPNGQAVLGQQQGVATLDIVAPDGAGTSHNQFSDYNVGPSGVVLNNALQPGQAALGPTLDANRHFQGQAASTIVLEVSGLSPSNIHGPQEIFGQRADYMLANPNGISLNGATFINANRASFLVGIPELEDGRIVRLSASHEQAVLHVGQGGASNVEGALELITPRLDTEGKLAARDNLDLIIGHNTLAHADRTVLSSAAASAPAVDAQLLGAMHAGRIRILSTTEGAGVRLPNAQVVGRQGVEIDSRGNLHISGTQTRNGTLTSAEGDVTLKSAGDMRFTALGIEGGAINVTAGKALRMDTLTREQITKAHDQWKRKAWFIPTEEYSRRTTETNRQHLASRIEARDGIKLESGTDMHLTAAQLKTPGDLHVRSGGELNIDAALDSTTVFQTVRHRKHLWRGDSNTTDVHERARGSNLEGGTVQIDSVGDAKVRGSRLHSQGTGTLRSGGTVTLDGVAVKTSSDKDDFRGDLVGGAFFGKTVNNQARSSDPHRTEVRSESNLQIIAHDKMNMAGPKVSAAGAVQIQAQQGIELLPAPATRTDSTTTRTQGFTASVGETKQAADDKAGSKQYFAQIGYGVTDNRKDTSSKTHVATELAGNSVDIEDNTAIKAVGAKVDSKERTRAKAPDVQLLAALDETTHAEKTSTWDGALRLTGGMDKAGSAFSGGVENDRKQVTDRTHQPTALITQGSTQVEAVTLQQQAAIIASKGNTHLKADTATHADAIDEHQTSESSNRTRVDLGATVEYTDLTRPIEKVVKGEDQSRFQHQALEDNLFAPSLGADLNVLHEQRQAGDHRQQGRVTQISGDNVKVDITHGLQDIGTHYSATTGTLAINADSHDQQASHTVATNTLKRLDTDTRARLDTNTGTDINFKIVGSGGSTDTTTRDSKALPSLYQGRAGVQIQLGTDGRYEGATFQSDEGPVVVEGKGNVAFEQARDEQSQDSTVIDGSAWAKVGTSPTAGKSMGGSVIGKYTTGSSADSQGRAVQIHTPGAVKIGAGKQAYLEGTQIGSQDRKVGSLDINAGDIAKIASATDTHQADGSVYGGGLQMSLSRNAPSGGKGGGMGASLELGRTDERRTTSQSGQWHIDNTAKVTAGSSAEKAIDIQGLHVDARQLSLGASKGGIAMTGGQSDEQRNNKGAGVGLGVNGANTTDAAKGYTAVHARATLDLDKLASTTHTNTQIRVEQLDMNSRRDTHMAGVTVTADKVTGSVGGDLIVESRQDQVNGHTVNLDARLNAEKNPQGLVNGATALAGPVGGKVQEKIGSGLQKVDLGFAPTLNLDVSKTQRDTAAAQTVISGRDAIALQVDGTTQLNGAQLKSPRGEVDLGGSTVNSSSLSGSDHSFGLEGKLSLVPEEMTQNLINAFTGTKDSKDSTSDLGLLRTKGHDQQQTLEGGIKHKQG